MSKRLLIFLLLFLGLLILSFYFGKYLGMFADMLRFYFSVKNTTLACANLKTPSSVSEPKFEGMLICENCGSLKANGYGEIYLLDPSQNLKYYFSTPILSLLPTEYFYLNFTAQLETQGTYTVIGRCYLDNNYTEIRKKIEYYIPPSPPLPSAPPAISIQPIFNISVKYPQLLNLSVGEESHFEIRVKNTGNSNLENLSILFPTFPIFFSLVYPKSIAILSPLDEVIFVVKVKVPPTIPAKTYRLNFSITSTQLTKDYPLTINVNELPLREEILFLISKYSRALELYGKEIEGLEKEGKNTSTARELWNKANLELDGAKNLYEAGLFDESLKKLKDVENYLTNLAIEIARLKRIKIPKAAVQIFPSYLNYLLLAFLIILSITLALIIWKYKRKERVVYLRRFRL